MKAARSLRKEDSKQGLILIGTDGPRGRDTDPTQRFATDVPKRKGSLPMPPLRQNSFGLRTDQENKLTKKRKDKTALPRRNHFFRRSQSAQPSLFRTAVGVAVLVAEGSVPEDGAAGDQNDMAGGRMDGGLAEEEDEEAARLSDVRMMQTLACMLEPLIELEESSVSRKKKQGALTLSMLLAVAKLAHAVAQQERGLDLRSLTPREASQPPQLSSAPTVQQQTAARRVKSSVATLRTTEKSDEKEAALAQLVSLVEKSKALMVVVLSEGGIGPIIQMMDRGSSKAKEQSLVLLRRVAELFPEQRASIVKEGGLTPLIKLLASTSLKAQVRVEAALTVATIVHAHKGHQAEMVKAGAVRPLVRLLSNESRDEQLAAAKALCSLCAGNVDTCKRVVSEDGVAPLARFILPAVASATPAGAILQQASTIGALYDLLRERSAVTSRRVPRLAGLSVLATSANEGAKDLTDAENALQQLALAFPETRSPTVGIDLLLPLVTLATSTLKCARHALAALLVLAFDLPPEFLIEVDAIPLFVRCLCDPEAEEAIVRGSAAALAQLAATQHGREVVTGASAELLVQLTSGTPLVQEQVMTVLLAIAEDGEGQRAIFESPGAAEAIVRLAVGDSPVGKAVGTRVLCLLARQKASVPALIAAGAAKALVEQLGVKELELQEAAAAALAQLTSPPPLARAGGDAGLIAVVEAGGVAPLVRALRHGEGLRLRKHAMQSLFHLAKSSASKPAIAADGEIIEACVNALRDLPGGEVREQAAAMLAAVSETGKRMEIITAGGVEVLMALLRCEHEGAQLQAVRALCTLADVPEAHLVVVDHALGPVVALAGRGGGAQVYAASLLHKLAGGENPKVVTALAMSDVVMRLFVAQLAGDFTSQRAAVLSLRSLCARHEAQEAVVRHRGVAGLVSVASNAEMDLLTKKAAAHALAGLAAPPHTEGVALSGGAAVLVDVLKISAGDPSQGAAALTHMCVAALEQLVEFEEGRAAILAGCVPSLVELLSSKSKAVQAHALSVIDTISTDSAGQEAVGATDAAVPLVKIAENLPSATSLCAAGVLCRLAKRQENVPALINAKAAVPFVALLRDGTEEQQEGAVAALATLTSDARSREARARDDFEPGTPREARGTGGQAAVVKAEGVPPLVQALRHKRPRVCAHAVHAVHNLAAFGETRSTIAGEAAVVSGCVQLLKQADEDAEEMAEEERAVKQHAVATLAWLADSGKRAALVEQGAIEVLMAVLEAGVDQLAVVDAARAICSIAEHVESHPLMAQVGLGILVVLAEGKGKAQEYAAATLHKLSAGRHAEALQMLASSLASVTLLVKQLRGSMEESRTAVSSLRHLTTNVAARQAIVQCGGVESLVEVAQSAKMGKDSRKEATLTLAALAVPAHAEALAKDGAVPVLAEAFGHGGAELTLATAPALDVLSAVPLGREAILRGGAVPYVRALSNKNEVVQRHALHVLARLALRNDGLEAMGAANAPRPLVLLAAPNSPLARCATGVLCHLARLGKLVPALIAARAAPPFVAQLRNTTGEEAAAAATALRQLTSGQKDEASDDEGDEEGGGCASRRLKKQKSSALLAYVASTGADGLVAAAKAGAVEALVAALRHGERSVQEPAMQTLYNLAMCGETRQHVAHDEECVGACVHMLRTSEVSEVKTRAAATLAILAAGTRRADLLASGGVEALMRLLQREGEARSTALQAVRALSVLAEDTASHALIAAAGIAPLVAATAARGRTGEAATQTLHRLASGGDEDAADAVSCSEPAVALLVRLLAGSEAQQAAAARSLRHIAGRPAAQRTIFDSDGGSALVLLAGAGAGGEVTQHACYAVAALARSEYGEALVAAGGVDTLSGAISARHEEALTAEAAGALEHLARTAYGEAAVLRAGVSPLVGLLDAPPELHASRGAALRVLLRLAAAEGGPEAIGGAGGAQPLVRLAAEDACARHVLCRVARATSQARALVEAGLAGVLVAMLRGGAAEEQHEAAAALDAATRDSAAGGRRAAVDAGCVPPLVRLLSRCRRDGSAATAASPLRALHQLTSLEGAAAGVAETEGLIEACVAMLSPPWGESVHEHAAGTLACIADAGIAPPLVRAGATEALVELLRSGRSGVALQAVRALAALARDSASHAPMARAGLEPIIALAGGGGEAEARGFAVQALHRLSAGGNAEAMEAIAGSKETTGLLLAQLDGTPEERAAAVASVRQIVASGHEAARHEIVASGGVASLVKMFHAADTSGTAREDAVLAIAALSEPPHSEAVAASGAVATLIDALAYDSADLSGACATALEALVRTASGEKATLHGGIEPLVSALGRTRVEQVQRSVLHVLTYLVEAGKGQADVGAAGAARPLVQLMDGENPELQYLAVRLLRGMASSEANCQSIVDAEGVGSAVMLLRAEDHETQCLAMGALGSISVHLADLKALGSSITPSTFIRISNFSKEHEEAPESAEAAAAVLALLTSDLSNVNNILITGGAKGLAMSARDGSTEVVRKRAASALEAIAPTVCGRFYTSMKEWPSPLLMEPSFWHASMVEFLSPRVEKAYPTLATASGNFYFELYHLCSTLVILQQRIAREEDPASAMDDEELVNAVKEVLETFENEPHSLDFISTIFPHVSQRAKSKIDDFSEFPIKDLPDIAHLGMEVLNRVQGMPLAEKALRALYIRYLNAEKPHEWKQLFKDATRTAYNLKYMFREDLDIARSKFYENLDKNLSGKPREMFRKLVEGAFQMYNGLVDQETLARTDFLTNPHALIEVVLEGVKSGDSRVRLLGEIATKYMKTYIEHDPPKLPLTPHHTQIVAMLIFSQFFEQKEKMKEEGVQAVILQMMTGEGKSIVIAMMAIYTVKQLGKRVHVLENNEGLLERDFAAYESFYHSFGLTCNKTIDLTSDICYCLKRQNNQFFNQHILVGDLDLSETVLIVDEVDDLVVNERPSLLYNAKDELLTPHYKTCYTALINGSGKPPKVDNAIWEDCIRIKKDADSKVKGVHYTQGDSGWLMLEEGPDGTPRLPKVPLTNDWLVYKNYQDYEIEPSKNTFRNSLCTPYMYTKYSCIFGLTGSVGGEAEREYIKKTYALHVYEVPQFLKTCKNTSKEEAKNLGVVIKSKTTEMIDEVVETAVRYHTEVPVLIITRGAEKDELQKVVKALDDRMSDPSKGGVGRHPSQRRMTSRDWDKVKVLAQVMSSDLPSTEPPPTSRHTIAVSPLKSEAARRSMSKTSLLESPTKAMRGSNCRLSMPTQEPGKLVSRQSISNKKRNSSLEVIAKKLNPRIQILQERNEKGESMIATANAVIEQATRRCYSDKREPYFQITVTDWFGGRGHDFDCMDEAANHAGGMLVIATAVPDAREWAQWKGRTARQDRPGQYFVVLSAEEEPFKSVPGLAASLRQFPPDKIIDELLRRKDLVTAEALVGFEKEQARGTWVNELCEKYYRANPRNHDEPWPGMPSDVKLRDMLSVPYASGAKIKDAAQSRLGINLQGPPARWGWKDDQLFEIEPKRAPMACIFLIDRTFEGFLQNVVDAVVNVYDKYLEPDDLVGYYGLGEKWIFNVQEKGKNSDKLREQIVNSVEKAGDPHVYSSITKCVDCLATEVDDRYSKWLVVLTDTADFECANEKGVFDKGSKERAEKAVDDVIAKMKTLTGLNLVIIDACGIANFDAKHMLWPTWHALSQKLTDEVGNGNTGLNIEATNVSEIDEAFEKVAGAMAGGGAAG
ncbi:hypothetical protein AB1Y20_017500 [Prymnesium parvum]|uniref:SecA DEAD-like N-terminal domain-containing protein n=1 Tax=Prymnesium parvum TaxID=97485 RepID=A0AB34JLG4_PRYPA